MHLVPVDATVDRTNLLLILYVCHPVEGRPALDFTGDGEIGFVQSGQEMCLKGFRI